MTEVEWLACEDARKKLEWLRGLASPRKLRLFACAYWRWHTATAGDFDPDMMRALAHAENWAEEGALPSHSTRGLLPLWCKWHPLFARKANDAANWTIRKTEGHRAENGELAAEKHLLLLSDLFGPLPFREVTIDPRWLGWNEGCVKQLATAIYDERVFEHMAVLADALEEAGCDNEEILRHCWQQGTVHIRGCWVLDLLLGKS